MKRYVAFALLLLALLALPLSAWAGPAKSDYNWQGTGWQMFYDGSTFETLYGSAPVVFSDEFLGAFTALPAAGSPESGCAWVVKDTGDAVQSILADTAPGLAQLAVNATSQKQEAGLYMNDNRKFDLAAGVVWEARVKLETLPTGLAEMQWGMAGDYAEGGENITYSAMFDADGSGVVNAWTNSTTANVAASVATVTATEWHTYRIDFTDLTSVKFYIDGEQVGGDTTFVWDATGANAVLQPYFYVYKASGNGVGTMQIDYVRIWSNRE
jgi:hypothetical protein